MPTTAQELKQSLIARIDERMSQSNFDSASEALSVRQYAREAFNRLDFPTRKDEDWKYTSVREILNHQFDISTDTSVSGANIHLDAYTFRFAGDTLISSPDGLPDGVLAGTLSQVAGMQGAQDQLTELHQSIRSSDLSIFEALALGMNNDPFVLIIDRNVVLDRPIHLAYRHAHAESTSYPYSIISLGAGSQAELIETYENHTSAGNSYSNTASRIFLAQNAHFNQYRLQHEVHSALHTANTTVAQERDSTYGIYIAELGGKLVRNNINITHLSENITSNIYGLFIAQDDQHIDTQSFIDHAQPNCQSNELFKGILMDRGRGVFNGKIIVRQDAQKINAYQQNAALVLSPDAVMDSKPQLEIYADDVRCSHGATIGQLDPDSLFYLKTRGLNDAKAKALLKRAFLKDVTDHFPNETIAALFTEKMEEELQRIANKS